MEKVRLLIPCRVVAAPQNKTVAGLTPSTQPDLLYMKSVLVSTGSNLNDDVFLPDEMWKARGTPVLKPVDWEHNTGRELNDDEQKENPGKVVIDNQTIGVMYNAYVMDSDGKIINETEASASDFKIPDKFDSIDEAVIWKGLYPSVASRVEKGAAENKLFVSMESWFSNYDYLIGNKIIARNEETAFLDNSLKANGGTGSFGDSTVKRILRNLTFGGKGIVERPANEPSVIQSVTHSPIGATEATNHVIAKNIIGNLEDNNSRKDLNQMSEAKNDNGISLDKYTAATEEALALRAEVKATEIERDTVKAEKVELEKKLEVQVVEASSVLAKETEKLNEAIAKVADLEIKLAATQKVLDEQAAEAKKQVRLAAIEGVLSSLRSDDNVEQIDAKVQKMFASSTDMNDEVFASYLDDYKETVALAAKPKWMEDKKKDEEDKKKKKEDESSDAGISDTDPSILDNVVATELAPSAGEAPKPVDFNEAFTGLVANILKSSNPKSVK